MAVEQDRHRSPAGAGGSHQLSKRWPARAQDLLDATLRLCFDHLHEPLRICLSQFDAQLFALADHSSSFGDQQRALTVRERMLHGRSALEVRFLDHLTHHFEHIDATSAAADDVGDSWHTLALVDPAEQELASTLEQLGSRNEGRHAGVLHELGYRIAVLVGAPPLEGEDLPLGPHALVQGFHDASQPLGLPLDQQLQLLRAFDRYVMQTLAPLYETANAQLRKDGILPQLRSISLPRPPPGRPQPQSSFAEPAKAGAEDGQPAATPSAPIEILESLRNLLTQHRAAAGGNPAYGGIGRAASTDELQTALGALQAHLRQVTDQASRELRSAALLQEELLTQLNAGKSADAPRTQLSSEQRDTVELVAMLFEQLGKQLQQGGSASALLGNLQLPVLRMAVADRGFFEHREHPARRLLETVTAAANDWLDGSDDETSRQLAGKLEHLVTRASEEPPSSALYTVLLADIEHHLALLSRKAKATERRHVEAAQGRDRLDAARHRATEIMAERFALSPPRGLLRALLERAWSDVLALTLLRHGEDSAAFRDRLAITDQLLGRVPIVDRQQLQQDVETGLQQIGMHEDEALQVAQRLLGGTPLTTPGTEPLSTTDLAVRLKQHRRLGDITSNERPVAVPAAAPAQASTTAPAPEPTPTSSAHTETTDPRQILVERHLRQLPFGTWFDFADAPGGAIVRRKLAWYSPMSGRCLLVTRRGLRTEDITLTHLAGEIANGRVHEVQPVRDSLVDRAWRGLTSVLRQGTPRPSGSPEASP
ncbi:MAG TPA: DUF1631 family protein [Rhodanobacter sp.]|nr:DUF1631 family protein [Rhodanobacter sp.]